MSGISAAARRELVESVGVRYHRIPVRDDMYRLTIRQAGQVVLYGADLIEKSERVEGPQDRAEPVLHRHVDAV